MKKYDKNEIRVEKREEVINPVQKEIKNLTFKVSNREIEKEWYTCRQNK